MNTNNWKDNLLHVLGIGAVTVGVGVATWLFVAIADVFTFWYIYQRTARILAGQGLDANLARIVASLFCVLIVYATHRMLLNILLFRKRMWVLQAAAIFIAINATSYVLALPYQGGVYDIFTGNPKAQFYRNSDGKIEVLPLGAKSGPEGQDLQMFDQRTAEEYRKQQDPQPQKPVVENSKKELTSFLNRFFSSNSSGVEKIKSNYYDEPGTSDHLVLWVEKIQRAEDRFVVRFAAESGRDTSPAQLHSLGGYLADSEGRIYKLRKIDAEFTSTGVLGGLFGLGGTDTQVRNILVGEVYHYGLEFEAVPRSVSQVKLYYSLVNGPIELDKFLSSAETVQALSKP